MPALTEEKAQQLIVVAAAVTIGSTISGMIVQPKSVAESRKATEKQEKEIAHKEQQEVKEGKKKKIENPPRVVNTHRAIVGGFFAMAGCSLIATFAPEAGLGLAALVAGGAFFFYGLPTIEQYYKEGLQKKK